MSENERTNEEQNAINDNQMSNNITKNIVNDSAKNELSLLAKLIGREKPNENEMEFWLNLSNEDSLPEKVSQKAIPNLNELNISEGIHSNKSLENIINDLNIDENETNQCSEESDLLELMDS